MVAKKTAVRQPATGKTGAGHATGRTAPDGTAAKTAAAGTTTAGKPAAAGKTAAAGKSAPAGKSAGGKAAPGEDAVAAGEARAADGTAAPKGAAPKAADGRKAVSGRKSAARGAAVERGGTKKGAARKTAAKSVAARETAGTEHTAARGAAVRERATGRTATGGTGAGRTATGKSTGRKAGAAHAAEQTGATTVVAKKTPGTATAEQGAVPKARAGAAEPGELAVRPGEDPWTPEEAEEARAELQSELERLRKEISDSEAALVGLMRDSGDGAGDDQADTGTKNITREHELALAANAREMLTQTERALERLDAGTYGLCENCGNPIGKARMQAFPRATLCVECKQKQERRS